MLERREVIRVGHEHPPLLLVVVDTEEEFDWGAPVDRNATSVQAMRSIHRFQAVCDEFHVRPTYVVDYPVASQREGFEPLREIADSGRATIGAHLHPWVNPPHEEEVCLRNAYAGNLGYDLESRKMRVLAEAIDAAFGDRPTVFRAGRYGVGPRTARILEEQGFEVDLSVCPGLDLTANGGPEFLGLSTDPYWFGEQRSLLEVPVTADYVGYLRGLGRGLTRLTRARGLRWARLSGILSRLGALERLRLSPEGMTPAHHRRLTRSMLRDGHRVFTFNLHSPSLEPGCTSYVHDDADLAEFLDSCRRYYEFFLGELGGVVETPLELKARLERTTGSAPGSCAGGSGKP